MTRMEIGSLEMQEKATDLLGNELSYVAALLSLLDWFDSRQYLQVGATRGGIWLFY